MNQPNATKTSGLAIAGLVSAFLCFPLGIILSIVALVKISGSEGRLGGKGLAIAGLAISLSCIPITGIQAAIAIPNFVKFQCRSKQSEAKSNLKALYVAEEAYHAEFNKYGPAGDVGFNPFGTKLRYDYEVTSHGPDSFTAQAVGTGEMAGDVWQIDSDNQLTNLTNGCN